MFSLCIHTMRFLPLFAFLAIVAAQSYPLALYTEPLSAVEVCSSPNALAKNFAVSISTDTPAKGENVSTTFDFDLDAPITGGTAKYSATLNGFGPYTSQANLCDETAKTADPCPLAVGHHHEVSSSASTVSGKVITTITWVNEAGAEILCARITTKTV